MIADSIQNNSLYPFGPAWKAAFEFLKTLTPDSETGKRLIQGDRLFAGIDCYETKPRSAAKLETHRKYVDIQVLLSGTETIEIFPKNGLTVSEPYNPGKDAEFYEKPTEPHAKVVLNPGQFLVFFPEDAHMPCLMSGTSPVPVKKVVFKIAVDLLK
ncbi:MAG: YhcH/YjgK/YiaL family protein [Verrucomicrobia bacterium]|nr:YhcH/YjgK/YiaL family protein [Verrucomicrobiota bacterium]